MQRSGQVDQPGSGNLPAQPVQRGAVIAAGEQGCPPLRRCTSQQQVPDQRAELTQHRAYILATLVQLVQLQQGALGVPAQNKLHQLGRLQVSRQAQRLQHGPAVHGSAYGGTLVQKAQAVPQSAVRQTAQQLRAIRRQVDLLLSGHIQQPRRDVLRRDALEGKPLAPGEDGGGHLVELRSGQNEHQVLRRLLQNLQQSIEGRGGEHVDLVHDVHPLLHIGRGVDGFVPQGPHLVDTVVGGSVQLQYIQKTAVFDAHAGGALAAGIAVHRVLAVDGLGQDFGTGGLAGAPGACEEVRMGGAALRHLLTQSLGDVGLADDIRKRFGPPFAVQGLIQEITSKRKKSSACSCGTGALAAHGTSRLMLLGSPPDMIRGHPLRETGSAAACGGL